MVKFYAAAAFLFKPCCMIYAKIERGLTLEQFTRKQKGSISKIVTQAAGQRIGKGQPLSLSLSQSFSLRTFKASYEYEISFLPANLKDERIFGVKSLLKGPYFNLSFVGSDL